MRTKRKNKFRIVVISVGVIYFIAVLLLTFYAVFLYKNTLPAVTLTALQKGGIKYTYEKEAYYEGNRYITDWDTREEIFLANIITPGLDAVIHTNGGDVNGKVESSSIVEDYIVRTVIKPDMTQNINENVSVTIFCDNTTEYDFIAPRSAVYEENGQEYISVISRESGPWGARYIASRENILYWPKSGTDDVVIMGINESLLPVVKTSTEPLYNGMEVTIVADESISAVEEG